MSTTMLDQGLYDAAEVAWLLGHDVEWVVRWTTPSPNGPAIVEPTFERMFSFADLVSFRVALMVREKGVSDKALRTGVATLRKRTRHARPLAVRNVIEQLATSGASFSPSCPAVSTSISVMVGRGYSRTSFSSTWPGSRSTLLAIRRVGFQSTACGWTPRCRPERPVSREREFRRRRLSNCFKAPGPKTSRSISISPSKLS